MAHKRRYADYVDYSRLDPVKELARDLFRPTLRHTERLGITALAGLLGETSAGFDFSGVGDGDWILTSNIESLGTKNRIADVMNRLGVREKLSISDELDSPGLYRGIGQDAIAVSLNDQVSIGADVFAYHDIITCGSSRWFSEDWNRTQDLLLGYREAADAAELAIPQGETPEVPGIVADDTLDLAGATLGLIRPKSRLVTGSEISEGDLIIGIDSSGLHANGITKVRKLAEVLPSGYATPLGNGQTLGQAALTPTTLYNTAILGLLATGAEVHYLQPVTGHGWSKICRAKPDFTYVVENVPTPPLLFQKLVDWGAEYDFDVSDRENYYTWNMGVGFIVIAPETSARAVTESANAAGIKAHRLGYVVNGPKEVRMPFEDGDGPVTYSAP